MPIVEPEIVPNGKHSIEVCAAVTEKVLIAQVRPAALRARARARARVRVRARARVRMATLTCTMRSLTVEPPSCAAVWGWGRG